MKAVGAASALALVGGAVAYPMFGNGGGAGTGGMMGSSGNMMNSGMMNSGSGMNRGSSSSMGGGSDRYVSTMPLRRDVAGGSNYNSQRHIIGDVGGAVGPASTVYHSHPTYRVLHEQDHKPSDLCVTGGCPPSAIRNPHVVVDRQEIARVIREKSCPDGMTLDGDTCHGQDTCPANYVCPSGTVPRGDRCISTVKPLIECPIGFEMAANGRCSVCDVIPAEYVCHDSTASLDHSGTSCSKSIEVAPYCPPGYKMEGHHCTQNIPAHPVCPSGYTMSGDSCVKTSTMPAAPVCPDGSTLVGDRCSIVRQDPPRCPSGYRFDANLNTCAQPAGKIPAPCPHGYTRVGNNCENCERFPAEAYCPTGYTMDYNSQCVKEIPVPPRCPTGHKFSSMDSNTCERVVAQLPICPDGQRLVGNRCELVVEHPSIECCPPGFELYDGRCRRVEELAPELTCENECYRTTTTKVAYACPDDAEFVDHPVAPKCVRKAVESYCPSMPASYRRCMSEAKEGRSLQGCPSVQTIRTAAAACPPAAPAETLPAQPFCPEGGVLEGNRCVLREPIIPERKCRVGRLDEMTGQCVRETYIPVKSDCPPGTTRRGATCVTVEYNSPDFICPDGAERNSHGVCVVMQAAISSAPRVSRSAPSYRCHTGTLSGRECVETSRTPMEMVCPAGTTETRGGCAKTAELITPPPVEKFVRPTYVCHTGSLMGQQCSIVDRVPVDKVCPADTTMDYTGSCVRTVDSIMTPPRIINSAARPVCPPGTQLRGNTCISTRSAEVIKSCPPQFELENNTCIRDHDKNAVCPAGTELSYDSCVRHITVPAKVKIVQGCAHGIVSACDTCPREVTSTCSGNAY